MKGSATRTLEGDSAGVAGLFHEYRAEGRHQRLQDFDDHLNDVSRYCSALVGIFSPRDSSPMRALECQLRILGFASVLAIVKLVYFDCCRLCPAVSWCFYRLPAVSRSSSLFSLPVLHLNEHPVLCVACELDFLHCLILCFLCSGIG